MSDWLVITSDATAHGRGVRGLTLASFLRIYFGRRAVRRRSPAAWRRRPSNAETLFVGLPSTLTPDEIDQLACRRLIVFDYLDSHALAWTPAQEAAFRQRTDRYLKPWRESAWNYGLRMGLLPIRRYGRMSTMLALSRATRRFGYRVRPTHDVAFLGRPNVTRFYVDGKIANVEQRVEWLLDLQRQAPDLEFRGGLVEVDPLRRQGLENVYGDLSSLWRHGQQKVNFALYFRSLQQSRVLLAPGGNVPWTYRHYECLYSGAIVVTLDYRQRDMLAPLPNDLMVHVPDGASVVPAVRQALELSAERDRMGEAVFAHLEQYFQWGRYARCRRKLLDRFLEQIA